MEMVEVVMKFLLLICGSCHLASGDLPSQGNSRKSRATSLVNSYDLNDAVKASFLSLHNAFRRSVSPTASDMRELTWDNDLEQLAKQYSSECIFGHSSGLGTTDFPMVGENIHRGQASPPHAPEASTTAWDAESQYYTFADNSCQKDKKCGHYLTLAWAATHKVGCGIALCNNLLQGGQEGFLTICHYGPEGRTNKLVDGVQIFDPPYQAGEACSACDSSLVCREGLCAVVDGTTATNVTGTATPYVSNTQITNAEESQPHAAATITTVQTNDTAVTHYSSGLLDSTSSSGLQKSANALYIIVVLASLAVLGC